MNQLKIGSREESKEHGGLARRVMDYKHIHGRLPSDRRVGEWIARAHLKEDKNFYLKGKK